MLSIIAAMRDWLITAGSDELLEDYCGYTAAEVVRAIDDMYPGGCAGWLIDSTRTQRSIAWGVYAMRDCPLTAGDVS